MAIGGGLVARPAVCWRGRVFCWIKFLASFAIFLPLQLLLGHVYELSNESLEENVFKSQFLHEFWERVGGAAELPNSTQGSPLLVFMHVPRTAGDAMRTHLFWDTQVDNSMVWPSGFDLASNNRTFLSEEHLLVAEEPSTKLIKGFYSRRDLDRINRSTRVFLFLRHPFERILSLRAMVKPFIEEQFEDGSEHIVPINVSSLMTEEKEWDWACTFFHNSMTWQLGDQQHCNQRAELSDSEVLERAKRTIRQATFVGFYEALDTDFWQLKQEVFPNVRLPAYIPFAFWLGSLISLPRLRVTKFTQQLAASELEVLRRESHLDLALYEWARERFHPELVLYSTYREYLLAQGPALVVVALLGAACAQLCCCCCPFRAPVKTFKAE